MGIRTFWLISFILGNALQEGDASPRQALNRLMEDPYDSASDLLEQIRSYLDATQTKMEELEGTMSNFVTNGQMESALATKISSEELEAAMTTKISSEELEAAMTDSVTITHMESTVSSLESKMEELETSMTSSVEQLESTLTSKISSEDTKLDEKIQALKTTVNGLDVTRCESSWTSLGSTSIDKIITFTTPFTIRPHVMGALNRVEGSVGGWLQYREVTASSFKMIFNGHGTNVEATWIACGH